MKTTQLASAMITLASCTLSFYPSPTLAQPEPDKPV